jgi:hypothetical protein
MMSAMESDPKTIRHYFVDEAGDPTLFGSRGKVLLGSEGCSRFFMLGVAHVAEPQKLETALSDLRVELMADPYFRGVPSFDPAQKKTALFFHAKDDLPEVRREVFRVLERFPIRIHVVVRDKSALLQQVRQRQTDEPHNRYQPNDIYDDCISLIFQNLLHQADENRIVFARRGKSSRIASLGAAIERAKSRYEQHNGATVEKPITVEAAYPTQYAGLQAMDYYLWALQRKYERAEGRFFEMARAKYEAIVEVEERSCGKVKAKNENAP